MQVYAPHDLDLANSCLFSFAEKPPGKPGDPKPKAESILFQFPPIIKSDGRKATWVEKDLPGREPVAAIQTSGPREISLSWVYIVDAAEKGWTTEKIATQVRLIRGYFGRIRDNSDQRNLLILFQYGLYGGEKPTTARIKSIDVKQSDTIIIPGDVKKAYPLRTDIVIELRLWNETKAASVKGLKPRAPDWY